MINKVCVIGSGVMGAGIAGQVANSGRSVVLLDISDTNSQNRNSIPQAALDRMLVQKPTQISHPSKLSLITIGNLEDDLELLRDCDLVIEVIVEKLDIKQQLYSKITPYLKPGAILSSNTSTLLLKDLKSNLTPELKHRFVITHFFNPPRVMELLELVTDSETDLNALKVIEDFMTYSMGKTIVRCNDTPGFIANRIGCFLLEMVAHKAIKQELDIVTIDNIFHRFLGFPSTGIFGLYDLIGHDVMALISASLMKELPKTDQYHHIYQASSALEAMRQKNLIGRKGGGGFYRMSTGENGKKVKEVIDPKSQIYSPVKEPLAEFHSLDGSSTYEKFIIEVLTEFLNYVSSLVPEVTTSKEDIDRAIRLGYGWKYGPFEMMSMLPKGVIASDFKERGNPETNIKPGSPQSLTLPRDDGILIFDSQTKMGVLTTEVFNSIIKSVDLAENQGKDLYILPQGANFSAGADLKYIAQSIRNKDFSKVKDYITLGQKTMMRLKYSGANIISCARGVALGGGCEILLHSDYVFAHLDLCAGLVEMSVELVPGWGGIKEMVLRSNGDKDKLVKNLKNILTQNKSSSADYFAIDYGLDNLSLVMNKNKLLPEIDFPKKQPKSPKPLKLPKINLLEEFKDMLGNNLQSNIIAGLNSLLQAQEITEEELLLFEQEKFLELAMDPRTLEKIEAVIGK